MKKAHVFAASILVGGDKEIKEHNIKNAWDLRSELMRVKKGAIFNIKDIGRLLVTDVIENTKDADGLVFYEIIIACKWISDWWDTDTKALVVKMADEVRRYNIWKTDFHRTWGYDEYYAE